MDQIKDEKVDFKEEYELQIDNCVDVQRVVEKKEECREAGEDQGVHDSNNTSALDQQQFVQKQLNEFDNLLPSDL